MFKKLKLNPMYSSYENDINKEFYIPVLSQSIKYDRATAYFSAKSLAGYAKGLENFVKNNFKYRLLVSSEISKEDYEQIKLGYKLKESLENKILKDFKEEITIEEEKNLSNLAYLISKGIVEIKIAFTTKGIFHDKFGIMEDSNGNIICFRGSNNETFAATNLNYEAFDITCSWLCSEFDYSKITKSLEIFEKLWNNNMENIYVVDVEEVILKEILAYNKGKIITDSIYLQEYCLLLDYKEQMILYIKNKDINIYSYPKYKMKLKRFIDENMSNKEIIFFKKISYIDLKKIRDILQEYALKYNYKLLIHERVSEYINSRELYINERSQVGLLIKQKDQKILDKFNKYKEIVNNELVRNLREQQMWDSFYMFTMGKCANFSVPGSGKTSAVYGVYAYLLKEQKVNKIVMVGPLNSFNSWIDEFKNCFGKKYKLNIFDIQAFKSSEEKKRNLLYGTNKKNLILLNYESLHIYLHEILETIDNQTLLIFDEVHKVKAINGVYASAAIEISKKSLKTIVLTGTPIPNSYLDIQNLLKILYYDEYNEYFNFTENQLKNPDNEDIIKINSRIKPFYCRTTKQQLQVPEPNKDIIVNVKASEIENLLFKIIISKYRKNKLVLIIRLLQLESNPKSLLKKLKDSDFKDILDVTNSNEYIEYIEYSLEEIEMIKSLNQTSKLKECIKLVKELYNSKRTLIVWCIFVSSIYSLKKELEKEGIIVECIYGDIKKNERDLILENFKAGKVDVLITNPHTLAESVSLHHICHDAIYYEYSYNLVHLLQSKDRVHRLGLEKDQYTQYYFLQNEYTQSDGTNFSLDNRIYMRLLDKENIMLRAIENDILEEVITTKEEIELIFSNTNL